MGAVSRETDFFQHGGDSLLATRLIGQLHQAGYEARLSDLFNHPGWLILPPRCVKPTSLLNNPLSTP